MGPEKICFKIFVSLKLISLTYSLVLSGIYEEASSFVGLSVDVQEITTIRCSTRCHRETCRGIRLDGSTCKLLFETNDIGQNERPKYNQVDLSGGDSAVFINVHHKCSAVNPCLHGGICEAVDWIYQCNCDGTAHHGPVCEKAGNVWATPNGWETPYPELNLNLDDQTPHYMHNGASHVAIESGYGFRMDGGSQFVDLGNWLNQTCFVDVDTCQEGFTLMAYVNIVTATNNNFLGYITSMTENNLRYGAVIYGYLDQIRLEVVTSNAKRYQAVTPAGEITFPTGWINLVVIYKVNEGIQIYVDNVLKAETHNASFVDTANFSTSGHIMLGRRFVNRAIQDGRLSVDWLTIWDRPLPEEERNIMHQN